MIYKESISQELTRWVGYGERRRATKTVAIDSIEHMLTCNSLDQLRMHYTYCPGSQPFFQRNL